MEGKIKIAIAGLGNCASSLVQGIEYYKKNDTPEGLMHQRVGPYAVADISVVAVFDVDKRKVGRDVADAVFSEPNCTKKLSDVPKTGVLVARGPVLDGIAEHMREVFLVDESQKEADVANILRITGAQMLICYLPVGSAQAARFYAQAALDAGVAFINAIPEFICSDDEWIAKFKAAKLPCAGDDIKSQVGATIVHRVLTRLIQDRGQSVENTYQLNIGGNTDFQNMIDESRLVSKRKSKTQAVLSILDESGKIKVRIGPSDYIAHLKDNKICYINIKGKQFADVPYELDLKLSVEDSPNSAGVMVDAIRAVRLALDRGLSGNLEAASAYCFKSPKLQMRDDIARAKLDAFIAG